MLNIIYLELILLLGIIDFGIIYSIFNEIHKK